MKKGLLFILTVCMFFSFTGCYFYKEQAKTEVTSGEKDVTKDLTSEVTVTEAATTEEVKEEKMLIAIDAGHQAEQNSDLEPIGPGASEQKMKVSSGTEGVSTGVPEYEVNLEVSKKLKKVLEQRGYEVLMIRNTHNVDLSNRERAQMSNEANADAFLRIHCNSAESSSVNGALTLCPDSDNPYCSTQMIVQSSRLAEIVLDELCANTGAKQLSIIRTSDMSGINWSEVPVAIIEMGFMSNPEEDENLSDEEYQDLLAEGIANGVDSYFEERK